MKILFILTGGTIEKTYSETDEVTEFSENSNLVIQDIIEKNIRVKDLDIEFLRVLQKDSLYTTDEDRQNILEACKDSEADKIVIVHGTSTMTQTAESLIGDSLEQNKTIVFTGAMRPYLLHGDSDAVANVSSALTAVQLLDKGLFLTMNGQIFSVGSVKKNEKVGAFEGV